MRIAAKDDLFPPSVGAMLLMGRPWKVKERRVGGKAEEEEVVEGAGGGRAREVEAGGAATLVGTAGEEEGGLVEVEEGDASATPA